MRCAAVDLGRKRIGLALSDHTGKVAFPLSVLAAQGRVKDAESIRRIVETEGVEILVVGLPKNMDGTLGKAAEEALAFVETLQETLSIPVKTWDERLTTRESQRLLIEANVSRKKRKDVVDKIAACLILQNYLDWAGQRDVSSAPSDPSLRSPGDP